MRRPIQGYLLRHAAGGGRQLEWLVVAVIVHDRDAYHQGNRGRRRRQSKRLLLSRSPTGSRIPKDVVLAASVEGLKDVDVGRRRLVSGVGDKGALDERRVGRRVD